MRNLSFLLLALLLMSGCASSPKLLGNPEAPYPPQREIKVGDIIHLPTGVFVDRQTLFDHASRAQIVYVGETHDNPASHRLQLDILRAMADRNPGKVSLGMEMFTTEQQEVLDRWSAGDLDEKDFIKQVDWYHNWRMDFSLYRDLLFLCRDRGIKIVALNADKELQKKVGSTPFDQLSKEEQARLPQLDMNDPYQKAMTEAVFSDHKAGKAMLAGFLRVQTLWDESMAQNVADYLADKGKDQQMVVIAGGNHIRYGYGIPRRVFRRLPASYLLVGSQEIQVPEDKQDSLMNYRKPNFPMLPYQFVLYTAYEEIPKQGVILGVMLTEEKDGLLLKGVMPGSIAAEAGLQKDDTLTKLNDIDLKERFDLIYELKRLKVGQTINLTLLRDGKTLTLPVKITEAEPQHPMMKKQ